MEPGHFDLLLVEDNPGDVELLQEYLLDAYNHWQVTVAGRLSEAMELLERDRFGVTLLDLGLPDSQGLDTLHKVLDGPGSVPVIVLTGHTDSDLAWQAVDRGAHDFLPKNELTPALLERSLRYAVARGRIEAKLREQKEQLQNVLDLSVMGIYLLDRDGSFTYVNRRLAEILGYEPQELVGMPALDLVAEEDQETARTAIRERMTGERKSVEYTLSARRKDGRMVEVDAHDRRIEMEGDGVILGAVTDITEKEALKRQLMHAQKLEAVGRLAGGVAHDFNNLLTAVRGNCELIIEDLPPSDPRRELLHEIRDAAGRATALTRQLLIFSRRDTVQPGKVDLHAAIEAMEQLLGRLLSEDIRIKRELDAGVPWTIGDPSRLEQMVMNLVLNAGDAMPEGGELWIQTTDDPSRAREWDPEIVPDEPESPWLYLRVADSGHGIDPEIESRIYDPFFTTKEPHEGTGLGLSTVYGIVTEADGRISAGESPMGGAQFTIRLRRTEAKEVQADGSGASSGGAGERIFLLEDEDSVRSVVRRILEKGGYDVVDVGDPAQAVSRFREAGEVDLLLSDIIMPGRHGPEIYEELTKLDPDLKALFISGYSEEATVQKVGELEAVVIPKPFSPTTLLEAVAKALAG